MLAKVNSAALYGIDALRVEVEIDLASGLPQLATVGLPEGAVKESKDRIRAAVKNCGYTFPAKRITINLAPADIKKEGSAYDLPMAIGILAAEGVIDKKLFDDFLLIGELSLDGTVKPVRGAHLVKPPQREAQPVVPLGGIGFLQILMGGKSGIVDQGDADALGQILHRFDEAHPRVLHDETDGRAMRAAAEAMEEPSFAMHDERRGLLAVKRTKSLVVGPRTFQTDVVPHNLEDRCPFTNLCNLIVRNHRRLHPSPADLPRRDNQETAV